MIKVLKADKLTKLINYNEMLNCYCMFSDCNRVSLSIVVDLKVETLDFFGNLTQLYSFFYFSCIYSVILTKHLKPSMFLFAFLEKQTVICKKI